MLGILILLDNKLFRTFTLWILEISVLIRVLLMCWFIKSAFQRNLCFLERLMFRILKVFTAGLMGILFWIIWLWVFQNVYTLMDCDLFRYVQVGVWDIASSVEGLLVIPLRVGSFLAGESHLRREIFKRWRVKVVIRDT